MADGFTEKEEREAGPPARREREGERDERLEQQEDEAAEHVGDEDEPEDIGDRGRLREVGAEAELG